MAMETAERSPPPCSSLVAVAQGLLLCHLGLPLLLPAAATVVLRILPPLLLVVVGRGALLRWIWLPTARFEAVGGGGGDVGGRRGGAWEGRGEGEAEGSST